MTGRIIVYSRTGTTSRLAEALAARFSVPISRITTARYGSGALGYARAGFDSLRQVKLPVTVSPAVGAADWVLLGGPIWTSYLSTPVRSYLEAKADEIPILGVFTTGGGQGEPDNIEGQIKAIGPNRATPPWLALTREQLDTAEGNAMTDAFEAEVRSRIEQAGAAQAIPPDA